MELGPPLRGAFLAAIGLAALACQAPVADFDGAIPLPDRDLKSADGGTKTTPPSPTPPNAPSTDAGADTGVNLDPCAAAQLLACFTFEGSVSDAKGKLTPSEETALSFVEGKMGKAVRLAGSEGSRLRFTASDALATPETTIEAWLELDASPSDEATIFESDQRHVMTIESDRTLLCASTGGAVRGRVVATGQWVHVACVFGGGSVAAYVDGIPGLTNGAYTPVTAPSVSVTELGNEAQGTRPMSGAIDTLRIFSVARTPAEIAAAAKP